MVPTSSNTLRSRLAWVPWVVGFAMLALAFWGSRPLWEPDEGRYGEAAREMAVSGDWLIPRIQGEPHLTKPPMTYWLSALGLRASGVGPGQPIGNAWGARFYTGAAFLGTMLCIVGLGLAWGWPRRAAWLAGLIFGSALLPFACGHILSTDMLLTFWETLGVLACWRVWRGGRGEAIWRLVFWAAWGLAFLTKGPPGLLPLLAVVAFVWIRRDPERPRLWSRGGLALALAIALPWFVVVVLRQHSRLAYFLHDEVVNRVFTNEQNRAKPFWFYFVVVPLGMAPWIYLWPGLIAGLARRLRGGGGAGRVLGRLRALEPEALFALLWFALPMCVFLISTSKMYLYVVPLEAPVALWMARVHVRRWPGLVPRVGWARWVAGGVALVWVAGMLGFVTLSDHFARGRSYVALAEAIRALPQGAADEVYVYEDSPDSISFYSNARLIERTDSSGDFLRGLVVKRNTRRVFLLIDKGKMDSLGKVGVLWRDLASEHDLHLVEILGAAND